LALVRKKEFEKAAEITPRIANTERRAVVKIALAQSLLGNENSKTGDAQEIKLDQQKPLTC
jgi:hypothetical protein